MPWWLRFWDGAQYSSPILRGVTYVTAPLHAAIPLILSASLLAGCAGQSAAPTATSYADAKTRYVAALENDVRARGLANARLVPIPPSIEPFKPGAAFKRGGVKPLSHACIVPEKQVPEAAQVRELWASGSSPRFVVEAEPPDMLKAAMQQVRVVEQTVMKSPTAMVSLADTTRISMGRDELAPVLRTEVCLNALVGQDVLMVQGIIYGAEAISNSRYLEVGAHQEMLSNRRYRLMYDTMGNYYLQDAEPKPKYWIVSAWRVDVKVEADVTTPEQRAEALRTVLTSKPENLVITERTLSDQDLQAFLNDLKNPAARKSSR